MATEPSTLIHVPSDEELADVLDEALVDLQSGKPVDLDALARRYPVLAEPLVVLKQLGWRAHSRESCPERVGPYRIECELGAGGFGRVYLAHDPELKRRVAVKLLHPGRLEQPEAVQRFHREAHATARLEHAGIVRLYDYSRSGPPYYLVTEYVEGVDLLRWCRQRRAGWDEIADLMVRLAEAVDHAHRQGVTHRDLKPGNVIVDASGQPHVLDFGLARLDEEGAAATSDGRVLGSLAYMAPEQAAGRSHTADARADVYSLGVILYQLLTNRLPFEGPTFAILERIVEEHPPAPRDLNPEVPRDLEAICQKAMAKRPDQRYRSAAEFAEELRAFRCGQPVQARPLTWAGRFQHLLAHRHRDAQLHDWSSLLVLEGLAILAGCSLANVWELTLSPAAAWVALLLTKLVQVTLMLWVAVRFRPLREQGMTSLERQAWVLVPGYYGSLLTLLALNRVLPEPMPLPPILAVLSGMGFMTLGAGFWGGFFVWGTAFFGLALLIGLVLAYGWLLLGVGWFLALVLGCVRLRRSR